MLSLHFIEQSELEPRYLKPAIKQIVDRIPALVYLEMKRTGEAKRTPSSFRIVCALLTFAEILQLFCICFQATGNNCSVIKMHSALSIILEEVAIDVVAE